MENNFYRPLTLGEIYFEKPVFLQIPLQTPGNLDISASEISCMSEPTADLSKPIYTNRSLFKEAENFLLKYWPILLLSGLAVGVYIYYKEREKEEEENQVS